jgi:uncharacterized protein (TIGR03066 family)
MMTRFTKLTVLAVALMLVSQAQGHAQQIDSHLMGKSTRSLVGGMWGNLTKDGNEVIVIKFFDDGKVVVAFIKKDTKEITSKAVGTYTLDGDQLKLDLGKDGTLKTKLEWVDDETIILNLDNGKATRWVRVNN